MASHPPAARLARTLLAVLLCAFAGLASARVQWTFIELPTPRSTAPSFASGVNNRGDVGGYGLAPTPEQPFESSHGFLWHNGIELDLGQPPRDNGITVVNMNDRGQLIGMTLPGEAWMWNGLGWASLGFVGEPRGINKLGDVAGHTATGLIPRRAVVVRDGVLTDLDLGPHSSAAAINDHGQVTGYATAADGTSHAFVWDKGVAKDLGMFNGMETTGVDIDSRGVVLGLAYVPYTGQFSGFIYDGTMRPLYPGVSNMIPRAMNERGDVIGNIDFTKGFLLSGGVLTLLEDIPEVRASGLTEITPLDINDRGWIVGWGYNASRTYRAFVMIPKEVRPPVWPVRPAR